MRGLAIQNPRSDYPPLYYYHPKYCCVTLNISLRFQDMGNLKVPIFTARPDQVEADQNAWKKLGGQKIEFLLAILPEKLGTLPIIFNLFYYFAISSSFYSRCCHSDMLII